MAAGANRPDHTFNAPDARPMETVTTPGPGPHGGPAPMPGFGGQLELRAIDGMTPGLVASISYTDSTGTYADGTRYSLRVPSYSFSNLYSNYSDPFLVSPRVAPAIIGLG